MTDVRCKCGSSAGGIWCVMNFQQGRSPSHYGEFRCRHCGSVNEHKLYLSGSEFAAVRELIAAVKSQNYEGLGARESCELHRRYVNAVRNLPPELVEICTKGRMP